MANRAAEAKAAGTRFLICNLLWAKFILLTSLSTGCGAWGREDRRAGCSLRLALGFDLADEHGGGDCADGNAAGLGSTDTVEDVLLVVGGEDAIEGGLRGSYDADAADEFVGAAVDVDAIYDQRDDLKGLRRPASGNGEA